MLNNHSYGNILFTGQGYKKVLDVLENGELSSYGMS